MRIKKGDTVFIRSGQHKGKTGRVLFVDMKKNRVVVEGVNMHKKHQRPSQKNPKGGVISIEGPVHMSNVALYSSSLSKPVKHGVRVIDAGSGKTRRIRINLATGEEI
jgi:large subunit ribosomal protein L24